MTSEPRAASSASCCWTRLVPQTSIPRWFSFSTAFCNCYSRLMWHRRTLLVSMAGNFGVFLELIELSLFGDNIALHLENEIVQNGTQMVNVLKRDVSFTIGQNSANLGLYVTKLLSAPIKHNFPLSICSFVTYWAVIKRHKTENNKLAI